MGTRGIQTAERVRVTCPCGKLFSTRRKRFDAGRGRYCSRRCQNEYQDRSAGRTGLKYNLIKPNPTSFAPNSVPWNKGTTGLMPEPWNKGTSKYLPSPSHTWEGPFTYEYAHQRVANQRGRAAGYSCSHQDNTCKGPMHWANINGDYADVNDYLPLCASHHQRYDKVRGVWGQKPKHR
jgi:hypothetical protein